MNLKPTFLVDGRDNYIILHAYDEEDAKKQFVELFPEDEVLSVEEL